jgi:hypothetical protein
LRKSENNLYKIEEWQGGRWNILHPINGTYKQTLIWCDGFGLTSKEFCKVYEKETVFTLPPEMKVVLPTATKP